MGWEIEREEKRKANIINGVGNVAFYSDGKWNNNTCCVSYHACLLYKPVPACPIKPGGVLNKRAVVSQVFYSNSTLVGISSRRGMIAAPRGWLYVLESHVGVFIYSRAAKPIRACAPTCC